MIGRRREKLLRPVHPNAGLEAEYRRKLVKLIDEMHESITYWIAATYRANTPEISQLGQDESPAAAMRAIIRKLSRKWLKRFDDAAPKLADWFAQAAHQRSDAALKKI